MNMIVAVGGPLICKMIASPCATAAFIGLESSDVFV
jgi:hypothetical protein